MNKKNYTKNDIINNLSKKSGLSSSYSKKLVDSLLIVLMHSIKKDRLILKKIGTFKVINKNERLGRNPKTKEKFIISSRKSISFIASKKILNILN